MSRFKDHKVLTLLSVNAIIILFLFIILEISARIFYPEIIPLGNESRKFWEYDSLLGWSQISETIDLQVIANSTTEISINSKKLRDDVYDYERNTNGRILVLGDSFAWGFGINKNERFSEIIERSYKNLEVINSAVPGYSTDQQLLYYLNEGHKYHPDYVLLLFCENDFLGNTLNQIHWYNKPNFKFHSCAETVILSKSAQISFRQILSYSVYSQTIIDL